MASCSFSCGPKTGVFARCFALLASLGLAGAVASCAGDSGVERGLDQFGQSMKYGFDGAVSETRTFDMPVDGVIDLDIETFAGDVVIRGGAQTNDKVEISANVRARHGRNRTDEAEGTLGDVFITADMKRGGDVPTLVVRATTKAAEPWLNRTDIDIRLPEMRRVTVKTRAGKVFVFESRGALSVHTTDGEIRVISPWTITENVTLVTRGADIVYRVNVGSTGLFDVDVVNGSVKARMEAGDWRILDKRNDQDTLYAQLGTGTNRVLMRTSDARVIVSVVKDPMNHGSMFLSP
ncbi:MAG: hypothetical protein JNK53_07820 [Phycisphaerae bacterium]|nr:hypothetical protein [Phycisphaerae bacterium]